MNASLRLDVLVVGVPVPQGSKSGFVVNGRAVITDQNKAVLKPWRATVSDIVQASFVGERIEESVLVVLEFRLQRPKSVRREHPSVKPDIDKLARAVLDGITDAGVWRDDAQVVSMHVTKIYADHPGVRVQVGEYAPTKKNTTPKEKTK